MPADARRVRDLFLAAAELPVAPGRSGEPVLLLPTLGASADLFRCGDGPTLASRLVEAGLDGSEEVGLNDGRRGAVDHGPLALRPFDVGVALA